MTRIGTRGVVWTAIGLVVVAGLTWLAFAIIHSAEATNREYHHANQVCHRLGGTVHDLDDQSQAYDEKLICIKHGQILKRWNW